MIFVQNKTEQFITRLGVATQKMKLQKKKVTSSANNFFQEDDVIPQIIKINQKREIEKQKERDNQINEKLFHSVNNIFSLRKKQFSENKKKTKNYVKLKNNMLFQLNVPGCTSYDPYLKKYAKMR